MLSWWELHPYPRGVVLLNNSSSSENQNYYQWTGRGIFSCCYNLKLIIWTSIFQFVTSWISNEGFENKRTVQECHDDVIKWKHFPRHWPFVRGIHRWPVNSPHKGQWRGALMFSVICLWINGWVKNREAGDLRRYRTHYDVTVIVHNYIH